jgi:hypothetical protein
MNGMLSFLVLVHLVIIPVVAYCLKSLPEVLKGDAKQTGPTMAQVLLAAKERARQDKAREV